VGAVTSDESAIWLLLVPDAWSAAAGSAALADVGAARVSAAPSHSLSWLLHDDDVALTALPLELDLVLVLVESDRVLRHPAATAGAALVLASFARPEAVLLLNWQWRARRLALLWE
jgi:hypothetical protein